MNEWRWKPKKNGRSGQANKVRNWGGRNLYMLCYVYECYNIFAILRKNEACTLKLNFVTLWLDKIKALLFSLCFFQALIFVLFLSACLFSTLTPISKKVSSTEENNKNFNSVFFLPLFGTSSSHFHRNTL